MYNPNCFENPATTDDKYFNCETQPSHTNAGVPSQVYALFVDGGEFQGSTYTGVGLLKAFHIFMRALGKHVRNTNFAQHADLVKAVSGSKTVLIMNEYDIFLRNPRQSNINNNDNNFNSRARNSWITQWICWIFKPVKRPARL